MAAVKLTKNEQKKQKDQLKRYKRYLPTLLLKKQQLQMVIRQVEAQVKQYQEEQNTLMVSIRNWIQVFGGNTMLPEDMRLHNLVKIQRIKRHYGNIAGVSIPVYEGVEFEDIQYDLRIYPLWLDRAIDGLKHMADLDARVDTLRRQIQLLEHELRITSQRVNLFEKVKIPETRENIRKIGIYLGDQQTAAVVRGKMAKNKLEKVS